MEPVAEESPPVLRLVLNVVVFPMGLFHGFDKRYSRPWPHDYRSVRRTLLEPAGARVRPARPREIRSAVLHEVIDGRIFGHQSSDVMKAHLANDLDEEVGERGVQWEDRTLGNRGEWTGKHEVVGHFWRSNSEIGLWDFLPPIL